MARHLGDIVGTYQDGVRRGLFDTDLTDGARADVVRLLGMARTILYQYGATPWWDVAAMVKDQQVPSAINERVHDILEGCAG